MKNWRFDRIKSSLAFITSIQNLVLERDGMEENHYNCIYMYVNKVNGRRYVGQAKDFNKRHKQHIYSSNNENDKGYNYTIHKAIRKYGIENFDIIILKENLKTDCLLRFYEQYYADKYDTYANIGWGYNVAKCGGGGNMLLGKTEKEMDEWKRKKSESLKGKLKSEEHKQKISEALKGNQLSEETKRKMSKSWKGKPKGGLIERWSLDGKLLDVKYNFEYVQDGFHRSAISSCCRGKRKSHKGCIFKYHIEE